MKLIKYLDLFAGCGGFSEGFEQTGKYQLTAAVEWEKIPCDTLIERLKRKWKYANAENVVIQFDMQRTEELLNGWNNDPVYGSHKGLNNLVAKGDVDLVVGGPPCQAYSIAGRIRDEFGMHYDYRNYLFESYLKIVAFYSPRLFVFENVEGMLSAKPGGISIVDRIKQGFSSIGYEIVSNPRQFAVIDFSQYGVPQKRKRVILLGLSRKYFGKNAHRLLESFYLTILPSYRVARKSTVKDAIGDLPAFQVFEHPTRQWGRQFSHFPTKSGIPDHTPRFHNKRDIEIFRELAHDIFEGNGKYSSIQSLKELYTKRTGKISNIHKYNVLRWQQQSNAIVAHLYKDGLRHIHPDFVQARSITVREAARLQTFADDFIFKGSMGDQFKMIGNAVPPLFAKILAEAIYRFLGKYLQERRLYGRKTASLSS